jgi:hypothetical protein
MNPNRRYPLMIPQPAPAGNPLADATAQILAFVRNAAATDRPVHEVERSVWEQLLRLGHTLLGHFFDLQGTGDIGPTFSLPDGTTAKRLDQLHTRDYRSVFGAFVLPRTVYGTREGQKILAVPFDAKLQLPDSDYSYVLQDWNQMLGCEHAFEQVSRTMEAILGQTQPVDSLETMNRQMAEAVETFRAARPMPAASAEGELQVLSADGKGVVIRRGAGDAPPKAHRGKGDKANKKRMAVVGAVYSIDRNVRTPEDVVAALFRDPIVPGAVVPERPVPVGKHVWARLSRAANGSLGEPLEAVFGWLQAEATARTPAPPADGTPAPPRERVLIMDGQEALWAAGRDHLNREGLVEVLDLLHVTPRLWRAAHLFHKEGTAEAAAFVRHRLGQVLNGQVDTVVRSLRQLGRALLATGRKKLQTICRYLSGNAARMRYDEYLRKGYPIASGVIEGACRHYVKDRMERAGMRWTKAGAQAMLDVRSEHLNGDWQAFQAFRIERETKRLYPYIKHQDGVEHQTAA